ncbi:hypothetical protein ABIC83_002893 [Roseateles asaccharophilus]|uniref:hypothetical protein n=1 Tax=Roseateles asaccharophilus TaxID=582607 RepID=UPI003832F5FD
MKSILAAISSLSVVSAALAQATVVTKVAPAPVQVKAGPVTVAPSATTVYTQPGKGPDGGPIPGTQAGSTAKTSYGVTATIPLPDGKKK